MMVMMIFDKNWADEFDVKGFEVLTEAEYMEFTAAVNKLEYPADFHFGSNEAIEFDDANEILNSFKIKMITDKQHAFLRETFNLTYGNRWGFSPVESIIENAYEPEEEN